MADIAAIQKKLLELQITDKTLVYPTSLRKQIESKDIAIDNKKKGLSFIAFYPRASSILVPSLDKVGSIAKNSLKSTPDILKVQEVKQVISIDSIILPIMPVDDNINCEWTSVEGMGLGNLTEYIKWKLYKVGSGIVGNILPSEAVYSMKQGIFGGGIDNPHDRLAFAGHSRRNFTLGWDFMKPESQEDEKILSQIISAFRILSLGTYDKFVIIPPISWTIDFMSFPNYTPLFTYKRCGFNSVQTKMGGEGEWHAMESGFPFMSLTLEINELDYATRDDVSLVPTSSLYSEEAGALESAAASELEKNKSLIGDDKKNKSGKP